MAGTCDEATRPACWLARRGFGLCFGLGFGLFLPLRLSATAARMRSFKAASSILSPSWMSMARLTFPSRLELNRPAGFFNAAPFANVILTAFLYVSPVQTMPPWDQTGVPGDVGLAHFHSSTISGSALCTMSRTFASIFPRQSPSSLIFSSMNAEADSTGTGPFMAAPTFAPNLAALSVTCNLRKWKPLLVRWQFGKMVAACPVFRESLALAQRHEQLLIIIRECFFR